MSEVRGTRYEVRGTKCEADSGLSRKKGKPPAAAYFPHPVTRAVSSALRRFTSVFGMGTGGSTSLWPPGTLLVAVVGIQFSVRRGAIVSAPTVAVW